MSPATTIVRAHARHRPLALAQGPLRPVFSYVPSPGQPQPALALHPAAGQHIGRFTVSIATAETLSAAASTAATTAIAID